MGRIIFLLASMLFCGAVFSQGVKLKTSLVGFESAEYVPIAGYTKIFARYEWIAGAFDSGLHVPQYNGVPSGVRSGVWQADGAVAVDTANHYFYIYSGGAWIKIAKYSDIPTTPTWQQTLTAGSTLTGNNEIDVNGFSLGFVDPSDFYVNLTTNEWAISGKGGGSDNVTIIANDASHNLRLVNGRTSQIKSEFYMEPEFIEFQPYQGIMKIDTLATASSMTDKAVMVWDSATKRWERIAPDSVDGGPTPISSLTAATGTNNISNGAFNQTWQWSGALTVGLGLYGPSAPTASDAVLFRSIIDGANGAAGLSTYAGWFANAKTGTTSTNVGGYFIAQNGTNNYAIIVPASGGSVGIGTSTPDSLLHNAGSFHNVGNGRFDQYIDLADISAPATPASGFGRMYTRTDSLRYKNDAGTEFTMGLGGGGLTVGTTTITSGTDKRLAYNNAGVYGETAGVEYYGAANMVFRSQAQAAADVALIGKAHASQSANIFEVQNSSGTAIVRSTAAGRFGATDFFEIIGTDIVQGNVLGTSYNVLQAGSAYGVVVRDNADNRPWKVEFGSGTTAREVVTGARVLEYQGTDVASAAGAIAATYGNSFEITGTSAITLISNVNWQNGSVIYLMFTSTATLTDGTANSGTDIGMELIGNTNFVGTADDVVCLILGEIGGVQRWRAVSQAVN
jgi:hypothetical protein